MIYVGVDPGSRSGAYAFIADDGDDVRVYAWDNDGFVECMVMLTIKSTLYGGFSLTPEEEREKAKRAGIVVCVEKVGAMPKQGISSTWAFAENFGYIQGVLHALKIPFQLVPPRIWKKEFSLTSDKTKSVEICHMLFPGINLKRTEKSHKDDNNLAEALLMSEYARRKF